MACRANQLGSIDSTPRETLDEGKVSIGFASQLDKAFAWAAAYRLPTIVELGTDSLLICAIVVSIGSWEAYFKSLRTTPLNDWPRFYSDIATVSLYVLLFRSIADFDAFRLWLVLIYLNYILWNVLSIRMNPSKYQITNRAAPAIFGLFLVGFTDWGRNERVRGPFIVFFWLIIICLSIHLHILLKTPVFLAGTMLATSHILYRKDLALPLAMWQRAARAALVLGIGAGASLVFEWVFVRWP